MPDIRKQGNKWCVYGGKTGKKLGCHDTKKDAKAQQAAINASRAGRGR